ncbi:3'-5' exonuclease family protein [Anaeromyxobacter oryzisoli]|uniref:exonuclease n=1 Tax=Anaeromyxobacter oryzisoli TaxID=2925408 RepID=UPI001F563339|nr:exonuclease [Anaeromyxobacter sp. SG63]
MSLYVVDVESDGPIPGKYSMVSFGAVKVEPGLGRTFRGRTRPISDLWLPEALAISGVTREEHLGYDEPGVVMERFERWVQETTKGRPVFFSDNLAYDWQFINWYFHTYLGRNPFGWSGRRIGDLYCGMVKDAYATWKHLRTTAHDHDPVNDAKGNAEAILKLVEMGLKLPVR